MSVESFGQYQLLKRLATGGMAEIFLARQRAAPGPERLLVLKRILPQLSEDQEFIRMFLDEARIAARLDHPNIVEIFDLGERQGRHFIAMEYLHGEDLRRIWKRAESLRRALPLPVVCRVVMDAAEGLAHAHRRADAQGRPMGIVHRDVSPQNILVTFEGRVKVVDFGIAKAVGKATQTRSGVLKGKYSYMSPEQAASGPVDHRSDLFALGVVLFELLTGLRLFKRATDIQTLNAVTECRVPRPSMTRPGLPESLDALVLKALSLRPEDRFQDGRELSKALGQWLASQQLSASSSEVAAFMRELYADRLERERASGRVLLEEIGQEVPRSGPGTPALPEPPGGRDVGAAGEEPGGDAEEITGSLLVGRPVDPGLPEPFGKTAATQLSPASLGHRLLLFGLGLIALGGFVAVGALWLTQHGPRAKVRIRSEPPGARVVLDGKALDQTTPCELPPVPPGRHTLRLGKEGFVDATQDVVIPSSGEVEFPVIPLERAGAEVAP